MTSISHLHPAPFLVPVAAPKRWQLWLGRIISAIPVFMMTTAGFMKLTSAPQMVASWVNQFGWPRRLMAPVGLVEILCVLLFVMPRTAAIGAILVTGFLGAAFASHLRIGDGGGGMVPLVLSIFAWLGLYLRDARLRSLVPLRRLRHDRPQLALAS